MASAFIDIKDMVIQIIHTELQNLFGEKIDLEDLKSVLYYLVSYGWISKNLEGGLDRTIRAIKIFQRILNLNETGFPDPVTIKAIITSQRCGCVDIEYSTEAASAIRRWRKSSPSSPLTYKIGGFVPGLSVMEQKSCWKEIWQRWSNVTNLHFAETESNSANIMILSGPQNAGDGLGSPGNVLAYAYLPPRDGFDGQLRLVMDNAERWEILIRNGIGILNVGVHEGGHILGLNHDQDNKAIMKPFYDREIDRPTEPDINRIRSLYGNVSSPTPVPPNPQPVPPLEPQILKPGLYKVV